jgi:hypothetical protein
MTNVLFVCVANSGRSVVAERLFRQLAGDRHQQTGKSTTPPDSRSRKVREIRDEIERRVRESVRGLCKSPARRGFAFRATCHAPAVRGRERSALVDQPCPA